jgi:hypothetical protein
MFACKSDPEAQLQVEAVHANSLGEPYNIGLIEVSDVTSDGQSKMRNGMRWLIHKMEQKAGMFCSSVPTLLISARRRRKMPSGSSTSSIPAILSPDSDGTASVDRMMWLQGANGMAHVASSSKRASRDSDMRSSSSSLHWVMQGPFAEKSAGSSTALAEQTHQDDREEMTARVVATTPTKAAEA